MSAAEDNSNSGGKKRENGQGSVFFHSKRNVWIARFSYRDRSNKFVQGKLKQKSFSAKTEEAALARMVAAKKQFDDGRFSIEEVGANKVYFIQATTGGPIKIGFTNNIQRRLQSLQMCCPVALRVLHVIEGVSKSVEMNLHGRFAPYRLHGEWFDNVADLLGYIHDLKAKKVKAE